MSEGHSLDQLPLEILHRILFYLDIPDILRIRRVSRHLNTIGYSRAVWNDAYRKSVFVRPPGPFASQSAHDLEKALVSSFWVDYHLRLRLRNSGASAQTEGPLKLREIRYTGRELGATLVFGHFLLVAFEQEVRCYDLDLDAFDSNSGASILYRPTLTGAWIKSFHCVSAFDTQGRPIACVVLCEMKQIMDDVGQVSAYSLKVVEESEVTLDLLHHFIHGTFCVRDVDLGPRVLVIEGEAGLEHHFFALDVHTRTRFQLPPISDVPDFTAEWDEILRAKPVSISTSTHQLVARSCYSKVSGWSTFFKVFILPQPIITRPLSIPVLTHLAPSHCGTIRGIVVHHRALLHDAVFDASTGDTLITLQVDAFEPSRPHSPLSKYGILRLRTGYTDDSINGREAIAFQPLGFFQSCDPPYFRPSFNGIGRAFYTPEMYAGQIDMVEYDVRGGGDSDFDASGSKSTVHPCILQWRGLRKLLDYDPYSGRVCLQPHSVPKFRVIEIYDFTRQRWSTSNTTDGHEIPDGQ